MSASRMPTRCPCCDKATARFAVTVDLPTPPLPEHTASTRVEASSERPWVRPLTEPRSFSVSACRSSALMTSKPSVTSWTPSSVATSRRTWSSKLERSGQPATVKAIVTSTRPPSISMERTMSSSVTGRCSSGSMTRLRASKTASRVGISQARVPKRPRYKPARATRLALTERRVPVPQLEPVVEDVEIERLAIGVHGRPRSRRSARRALLDCGGASSSEPREVEQRICGEDVLEVKQPGYAPDSSGSKLRERACGRRERARIFQHRREEIAVRAAALERDLHREVARNDSVPEFLPPKRRRHGRAGLRPHRVDGRDRLAPAVLPMIDEHALALLLQPLSRHEPGMPRLEQPRRLLGEVVCLLEGRAPRDRRDH